MAYYALLDENNIVTAVFPGRDEDEVVDGISDWEAHYAEFHGQRCIRTSYNTRQNTHTEGKEPFRGNFGEVDYFYDEERDAFIPPQPYPSWTLDSVRIWWEPPVPYPEGAGKLMYWDEEALNWVEFIPPDPPD